MHAVRQLSSLAPCIQNLFTCPCSWCLHVRRAGRRSQPCTDSTPQQAPPAWARTCVMAPAATPATAMAAGSSPATLMPWLAARLMPKKPAPAASMMAGVADAAALQPASAEGGGAGDAGRWCTGLWCTGVQGAASLGSSASNRAHHNQASVSAPLTLEHKFAQQHERNGAVAGGDRHIRQHALQRWGVESARAGSAALSAARGRGAAGAEASRRARLQAAASRRQPAAAAPGRRRGWGRARAAGPSRQTQRGGARRRRTPPAAQGS